MGEREGVREGKRRATK